MTQPGSHTIYPAAWPHPCSCPFPCPALPQTLTVLDTLPGLDEVARFNAAASNPDDDAPGTDLSSLMATLPTDGTAATKAIFTKGDRVSCGWGRGAQGAGLTPGSGSRGLACTPLLLYK